MSRPARGSTPEFHRWRGVTAEAHFRILEVLLHRARSGWIAIGRAVREEGPGSSCRCSDDRSRLSCASIKHAGPRGWRVRRSFMDRFCGDHYRARVAVTPHSSTASASSSGFVAANVRPTGTNPNATVRPRRWANISPATLVVNGLRRRFRPGSLGPCPPLSPTTITSFAHGAQPILRGASRSGASGRSLSVAILAAFRTRLQKSSISPRGSKHRTPPAIVPLAISIPLAITSPS